MTDQYLTIEAPAEGYYMDKGSKFHAFAFPVTTEQEIQSILQQLRKAHPKARHFCTAWRLHPDGMLERSNDDGEPSGSAGKPILGQIIRLHLTQILVVVVRYFGGTKLGIPGLIEAYKTSTANALEKAVIRKVTLLSRLAISMSYDAFPSFLNYCKQQDIHVLNETFNEEATLVIGFRKSSGEQDLLDTLKGFSHLDFKTAREYGDHLGMTLTWTGEEEMV